MCATVSSMGADIVHFSEYHKFVPDDDEQYSDAGRNAALIATRDTPFFDAIDPCTNNGFRRIERMGTRIYSG